MEINKFDLDIVREFIKDNSMKTTSAIAKEVINVNSRSELQIADSIVRRSLVKLEKFGVYSSKQDHKRLVYTLNEGLLVHGLNSNKNFLKITANEINHFIQM